MSSRCTLRVAATMAGVVVFGLVNAWEASSAPTECGFRVVASPNAGTLGDRLSDVAVVSATDAWAVGSYVADGYALTKTLIQHWDGSSWKVVPSPNRLTTVNRNAINALHGVTANGPNDIWAVGYTVGYDVPYQTLTMHWDGAKWSIVDSPNYTFPGAYNALNDVIAVSPSDVWAVGGAPHGFESNRKPITNARGLVMHWDGRAWSLAAGPPNFEFWASSTRSAVTAVSSREVWAVGDYDAWRWDGSRWSVASLGAQFTRGVDAPGSNDVWATGYFVTGSSEEGYYGPFGKAERWNGSAWQQQNAVSLGVGAFNGVAARSAADVLAVGSTRLSTFAARWNGSEWVRITAGNANPAPNTNRQTGNLLYSVDTAVDGTTWAVGYYYNGRGSGMDYGVQRTLVERYAC